MIKFRIWITIEIQNIQIQVYIQDFEMITHILSFEIRHLK